MTATHQPKPRPPRRVLWISIAAGLVLAAGAVAAGYAVGAGSPGGDAAEAGPESPATRPEPEASAPSVPLPTPSKEPVSVIPADCSGIYTTDWSAQLGPLLVLNPMWTADAEKSTRYASSDPELLAELEATAKVTCVWAQESGGSDLGLTTNVAKITPEQRESALGFMTERGDECYEELSGTRCISERNDDGASWGESHFFRDDVWIATHWVNSGPDGYTHDIINTLWP